VKKSASPLTADQYKRIKEKSEIAKNRGEISALFSEAVNRLEDECKRKVVMSIEADHVRYFVNAQFFDPKDSKAEKVSVKFPSAAEDISEAGKCLACGRSTACVMHLGRVLEVGLKVLAGALGVGPQHDWGKYLSRIDDELTKRMKSAGARTADEQFYAEAHAMFDSVRRAWRNPTMHVDKTYTVERAEEILIAVRSFMRHLAMKLQE
jgi:hypothetical protein